VSDKQAKSKTRTKIKSKAKTKDKAKTKYRLTVAADKIAVLLRLPKTAIEIIDGMAKTAGTKRTTEIYGILGAHPMLTESMETLLNGNQD
jgi:hypothetical protein